MKIFVVYFVCIFVFPAFFAQEQHNLQQQEEENAKYLNPINDNENGDQPAKDQDKRTIFPKHHGWARHVGVHPSGFKYVIGYGPVDLKYVPVVKPVSIKAHHITVHNPPKWHKPVVVKPLLPVQPVVHHDGWKPIHAPIVKPVPVHVPAPPHLITKPWQQTGWETVKPAIPHVDIVPAKPVHHVDIIPAKPVHHIDIVKPVHHVDIVKPIHHVDVVKPVHIPTPVKPILNFPIWQIPTGPAGLPLHNPVLIPQYAVDFHGHNLVQPAHIHPAEIHPAHIHPAHIHPAQIHPNIVLPEAHIHPAQLHPAEIHPGHIHPAHLHPGQVHAHEAPLIPHAHEAPLVPHVHPVPTNVFQQELPHAHPVQEGPYLYQQNLPGNVQHLFNQQIQHGDGATSNILLHGATIKPGHTDVQVPVHLPQHPNYLPPEARHFQPSITLEPPFTHK